MIKLLELELMTSFGPCGLH